MAPTSASAAEKMGSYFSKKDGDKREAGDKEKVVKLRRKIHNPFVLTRTRLPRLPASATQRGLLTLRFRAQFNVF